MSCLAPRFWIALLVLASVLTISAAAKAEGKSSIGSRKVLVILPLAAPSHHNLFSALIGALLERGHYVTIVSPRPQKAKHPRLREITIDDPLEQFLTTMVQDSMFKGPTNIFENTIMMTVVGPLFNKAVFESQEALALREETFDLLVTEAFFFQEPLLGFAHHFGCPSMVLNPIGYMHHLNYFTGGAVNPAHVPNFLGSGMPLEIFWDRLSNTVGSVIWMLTYQFKYLPEADAILRKVFPDAPPIRELVKNVSLTLLNNNFALMDAVPLAPSVIQVAGLHIKPGQPLPDDLKKWMDDSKDGIVYFSLGSNIKPGLLPDDKKEAIFNSFGKLKQKVLVKWNGEIPANAPRNCRFEEWLPQQQILAHPNLKVFVTHGGLLSMQETVYFGAALVAMPVFGDQHMNALLAERRGFALRLAIHDLTTDALDAALNEVITNPKYRQRSKELSRLFRLDPTPSLEKAIYYTEQLMHLGSLKHLQPSSVHLPWYQFLLLDVIAVIAVICYISWRIVRCICSLLFGRCCASKVKHD